MKIAICDRDMECRIVIEKCIHEHLRSNCIVDEISTFSSGNDLLSLCEKLNGYSLIFLDISETALNGIQIAKEIRKYNLQVPIALISRDARCSLEGYKVNAMRYIKTIERSKVIMTNDVTLPVARVRYKGVTEAYLLYKKGKE